MFFLKTMIPITQQYPRVVCFVSTYPLDSDLSGGQVTTASLFTWAHGQRTDSVPISECRFLVILDGGYPSYNKDITSKTFDFLCSTNYACALRKMPFLSHKDCTEYVHKYMKATDFILLTYLLTNLVPRGRL